MTSVWQSPQRTKSLLEKLYISLIILDLLLPIVSLGLAIYVFSLSRHGMCDLAKAHFQWLRKTLVIYLWFVGIATAIILISHKGSLFWMSGLTIFMVGYVWAEWREIRGLLALWQKKTLPSQG